MYDDMFDPKKLGCMCIAIFALYIILFELPDKLLWLLNNGYL
jgi:hypothetical protein